MVRVNSFIEENATVMNDFLLRVASDPNKKDGNAAFLPALSYLFLFYYVHFCYDISFLERIKKCKNINILTL